MTARPTLLPRWHPATLRAAAWALRAIRDARRGYAQAGHLGEVSVTPPPALPAGAVRGVDAALNRTAQLCLVRATVRQAWEAAQGHPRDVVIGVTAPSTGFKAHAWLDGDDPCHSHGYTELTRWTPEAAGNPRP